MNKIIVVLGFILISLVATQAQDTKYEEISIPLTNSNETGTLNVSLHHGGINLEGYNGNEVLITLKPKKGVKLDMGKNRDGLKRINGSHLDFEIEESSNRVTIKSGQSKHVDLDIKVPKNFNLNLSTHHDGAVSVDGVNGELEVNCHHSGMTLNNIGGSLIAGTHHGSIVATFNSVEKNKPMAFTTHHGDVDISFPGGSDFNAKMKSTKGDIFTDFEFISKPNIIKSDNGKKVKIKGWMEGNVGSGGKEYMFSTYHGDVILRQTK